MKNLKNLRHFKRPICDYNAPMQFTDKKLRNKS